MKTPSFLVGIALTAITALAAIVGNIDGKWAGYLQAGNRNIPLSCVFKANGTTLAGTFATPAGEDVEISDGRIDGDRLSFNLVVERNGKPVTIHYTGKMSWPHLRLTESFEGRTVDMELHKQVQMVPVLPEQSSVDPPTTNVSSGR